MFKSKLLLCACFCVLAALSNPAKGDTISIYNPNNIIWTRLSDLIVYGDPNDPNEKKVILKSDDSSDDKPVKAQDTLVFEVDFKITKYEVSTTHFTRDNVWKEVKNFFLEVKIGQPSKVAMIVDPNEVQTVVLVVDQSIAPEPPPEGTLLVFNEGRNKLMPGWFAGTGINFDTGEVTGAYTGYARVVSTALEVLVFTPPYPPNGATGVPLDAPIVLPELPSGAEWRELYVSTNFDDVKLRRIRAEVSLEDDRIYYKPGGFEPCMTYYCGYDDCHRVVNEVQVGEFIIIEEYDECDKVLDWSFTTGPRKAAPYPAPGSINVATDVILRWTSGCETVLHDVYFSNNFDDVNDANTTTSGIYRGRQDANNYTPTEAPLVPGEPYFWRIDEVRAGDIVSKGPIRWFATETDECAPTQEELTPPPAPEGYEYLGYDVTTGYMVKESTLPEGFTDLPGDINVVRIRTIVKDGVVVCKIIVRHVFRKRYILTNLNL